MAKAFWIIRPNAGDGTPGSTNEPDWPVGFQFQYQQVIGDLRAFGPDVAPADHKHTQIGPISLGTNHYHWCIWNDNQDAWYQETVGGTPHSHDIPAVQSHFLVFCACTDANYALLPTTLICGHASITQQDNQYVFGDVDATTWDASTRTAWENRVDNFGLVLPTAVNNDRRLVRWLLTSFHAPTQNIKSEINYRVDSVPVFEE